MKITLLFIGKTVSPEIKTICHDYQKRISHCMKTEEIIIDNSSVKASSTEAAKEKEGELILKKIISTGFVILLDDKGKEFTSVQFSNYLETIFSRSIKNLYFVVGGAYGFSNAVYERANAKLSLSKMTFSHQIVRAIFYEQLYRAFTIIRNEPYHH